MSILNQMIEAEGHKARVFCTDDVIVVGKVCEFTTAEDNEEDDADGYYSITLDTGQKGIVIEIKEEEIKSIELLD